VISFAAPGKTSSPETLSGEGDPSLKADDGGKPPAAQAESVREKSCNLLIERIVFPYSKNQQPCATRAWIVRACEKTTE
jgi:hypothetical protein